MGVGVGEIKKQQVVGRPPKGRVGLMRRKWRLRMGISGRVALKLLDAELLEQLSLCKSQAARRLILGVSR